MIKKLNGYYEIALLLVIVSLLTACGNKSPSVPTTIPNSATIFYAHNFVFRNSTTLSTGYNGFGQLGTGNLGNRSVPGYLAGNPLFKGFATGGNHSVAFFNNSTVRSWGYNALGQLGNDTLIYSSVPVKTLAISNVTAVAAGGFHSLALKSDDTLWSWGSNELNQLGVQATTATSGHSTHPVRVGSGFAFFANISSIAAGGKFSLARASGNVWAWGDNAKGQIGLDPKNTATMAAPVNVNGLHPGLFSGSVAGIAAGGASAYAIAGDKTVWAWGNNEVGQLGNNCGGKVLDPLCISSWDSSFTPVQVVKVDATAPGGFAPLTGVVQIAAGIQHALARLDDGSVWAWGYNLFGQVGNSGLTVNNLSNDSLVAVKVDLDTSVSKCTDIRAFGSSSTALVGGLWYAWGDNSYGQLGNGSTGTVRQPVKMSGF